MFIPNTPVVVDGNDVNSNAEGIVTLSIPLERQKRSYIVKAPFPLEKETIDMPCGGDDNIIKW